MTPIVNPTPWVKRIGIAILLILITSVLYKEIQQDLFYEASTDQEVNNLKNKTICGIQPGTRTFEIVPGGTVVINGENTDIRSALRINGALPKTRFEVNQNGCVIMSFAVNENFKNHSFGPVMLIIKFN